MDRRSFLKLLWLGAGATAAGLVLPDVEPVRRYWQVGRGAPVGGFVPVDGDGLLLCEVRHMLPLDGQTFSNMLPSTPQLTHENLKAACERFRGAAWAQPRMSYALTSLTLGRRVFAWSVRPEDVAAWKEVGYL